MATTEQKNWETLEAVATTEQKKVQKAVTRAAAVYDRQLKIGYSLWMPLIEDITTKVVKQLR